MTAAKIKTLLDRIEAWPEAAQDELIAVANEIETEFQCAEYDATPDELRVIDAAVASLDAGDAASDVEVEAAFAKFRSR